MKNQKTEFNPFTRLKKIMKNDKSEVVATSDDLSDVKQTILIVSDDKYLVVNQNKRVSEYIVYILPRLKILFQFFEDCAKN